jgi:hypothetical protein
VPLTGLKWECLHREAVPEGLEEFSALLREGIMVSCFFVCLVSHACLLVLMPGDLPSASQGLERLDDLCLSNGQVVQSIHGMEVL